MLQHQYGGEIVALGDNVKRLRRDKRWTQGDLAEAAGVTVGQISKIELNKANPKLTMIMALIDALECSPNALLSNVKDTNLDGRIAIALERVQSLPEEKKEPLLVVLDQFCIGVGMQGVMEKSANTMLNIGRSAGKTEELVGD